MSFIDELKAKSDNADNTKQEVINEIKSYFDDFFDGNEFEENLRLKIGNTEIRERKVCLRINFEEYSSGYGTTRFLCCGNRWFNPEHQQGYDSMKYKGVELSKVNQDICTYLGMRLVAKMEEMGFAFINEETVRSRFGYFNKYYYFGW